MQIPASCEPGTYLDSASDECVGCPAGSVCAGGASPPRLCPRGSYCVAGVSQPTNCPAGRYGSDTGLSDASCSGECAQGYYCEAGSVSAKAAACAEGSYGGAAGLVAQTNCTTCPVGMWCSSLAPPDPSCCRSCPPHRPPPWRSRCPPRSSSPVRTRQSTTRPSAQSRCRTAPRGSRLAAPRSPRSSRHAGTASAETRRPRTCSQPGSPGTGWTPSRGTCLG